MELDSGSGLPSLDDFIKRTESLEEVRLRARATAGRVWLQALGIWALAFAVCHLFIGGTGGWAVFGVVAVGVLIWAASKSAAAVKPYKLAYREQVLDPLLQVFLPGFEHDPAAGIDEETYLASRLFPSRPDRYHSEDRFSGELEGVPLIFAQVHAQEKREDCDKNGCKTNYLNIFKGLFAVAEFPKKFEGVVLVYPDRSEKLLGHLSRGLQQLGGRFRGLRLIKLEDPEFERRFVVYADDPVTARYVLSASLMEALRRFNDRHGQVYVSFVDGALYLAVPLWKNVFEPPPVCRKAADPAWLRRYAEALAMMRGVVTELKLNVRIWGERALE